MLMKDRPLFFDVSSHQGTIRYAKLAETPQPVLGMYIRAGYGLMKDPAFERNYDKCGEHGLYRTSYWAYYPQYSLHDQLAKWIEQQPVLDGIPRVIDLERGGTISPSVIADFVLILSDEILKHDGLRPWIYTRANLFDAWIAPYWLETDINMHFYILAQYDDYRHLEEDDALVLPNKMHIDRVLFKQTADEIAPAPLGLAPEAAAIDRNRWLLGGEEQMHDYLRALYFEPEPEPLPQSHKTPCATLTSIIGATEAGFVEGDKLIKANAAEIEKLENVLLDRIAGIEYNYDCTINLVKRLGADITKLKARAVELGVKLDLFKQEVSELDTVIDANLNYLENTLNERIDGLQAIADANTLDMNEILKRFDEIELQNNHTHPKWMQRLGLIK